MQNFRPVVNFLLLDFGGVLDDVLVILVVTFVLVTGVK